MPPAVKHFMRWSCVRMITCVQVKHQIEWNQVISISFLFPSSFLHNTVCCYWPTRCFELHSMWSTSFINIESSCKGWKNIYFFKFLKIMFQTFNLLKNILKNCPPLINLLLLHARIFLSSQLINQQPKLAWREQVFCICANSFASLTLKII